ncbi:MAG: hypothetical protein ACOZNI_20935 [Myxococcota bacterium]
MVSWRAALSAHAVLTEDEAVAALPVNQEAARGWLHSHVRPRTALAGIALYVWADVVEALGGSPRDPPVVGAEAAASVLGVSRSAVDRRIRGLPPWERPVSVGSGRNSRWWWPSREAVLAWWAKPPPPAAAPTARSGRSPRPSGPAVDVRSALRAALGKKPR